MSLNFFNPFFSVKIMDGLFISNQTAAKEQQFILNNKFSLIVNTCPRQFKILPITNIYKVTNFHWQNSKGQSIQSINLAIFKPIFDQITHNIGQGQGTLVASDRGHSRSITFVLLYLMDRFGWELFKALEYVNSKRQNLSVRATYLKLLVNHQKTLNGSKMSINKNNNQNQIAHHIRQSQNTQKWSEDCIKSNDQRILSNTFKNSSKKRNINQINECYRIELQNIKVQKTFYNNKAPSSIENKNKMTIKDEKKIKKSVKFSNQIEIITNESAMLHIFPQYKELSSDNNCTNDRRQYNIQRQQKTVDCHPNESNLQSHAKQQNQMKENQNIQVLLGQVKRNRQKSGKRITNFRKIQKVGKKTNQLDQEDQFYLDENDIFQNQSFEKQYDPKQDSIDKKSSFKKNNYQIRQVDQNTNQLGFDVLKVQKEKRKSISKSEKMQKQEKPKMNGTLTKKCRLSSYKRLKATYIQNHIKKSVSPQLKQKVHTEPEFELQSNKQIRNHKIKINRPLKNQNQLSQKQIVQNKKHESSMIGIKTINGSDRKILTSSKQQKRSQTPQIVASQSLLAKNQTISLNNNLANRPLSRGKNNSVRVNKKNIYEQDQKKNIFNININLNIGKLQMFTGKRSSNFDIKESLGRESLMKNLLNMEKIGLSHSRPRSKSSNENYSKYSASSNSSYDKKKDSSSEKIQQRQLNKIYQQKLSQNRSSSYGNYLLSSNEEFDQNQVIAQSFSKKEIMEKINRKLINNSRNSKRTEEQTKNSSILQNNFL